MWVILVLILLASVPRLASAPKYPPTPKLTVAGLERLLSEANGSNDKHLAEQIYNLKLTERLSDENLTRLLKLLPGRKSQDALIAIADESSFLNLPESEIRTRPTPSTEEQSELLVRTKEYVTRSIHKLPDFYATRTTTAYMGTPTAIPSAAYGALFGRWGLFHNQRLAPGLKTAVTVLYRNGRDIYADQRRRVRTECPSGPVAISTGQFGAILALLPGIIAQDELTWDHWESSAAGYQAVFRYSTMLPYQEPLNCPVEFHVPSGVYKYQGEVAVRPEDGTVMRMTRQFRSMLDQFGYGSAMTEVDVMVKYGAVEIGQVVYTCPIKGVFLGLGPQLALPQKQREAFDHRFGLEGDPTGESVDDVDFRNYHVFRGNVHVLPGYTGAPVEAPSTPLPSSIKPSHPKH